MATPRSLQCLQALRSSTKPSLPKFILPFRPLSTTPCRSESFQRAIEPPEKYISYDTYLRTQNRERREANQLAVYRPKNEDLPQEAGAPVEGADISQARLVPASPSYFTAQARTTDDIVYLSKLLRKSVGLPQIPVEYTPKAVWKPLQAYRLWVGEAVSPSQYSKIVAILHRLNRVLPELRSQEVTDAINAHLKDADRKIGDPLPGAIDEWGRGFGAGRRKTAKAMAWLVEGSGDVLVNERNITDVFGRVKDRESALWPLTSTGRMNRYNVFAVVRGGGTTGWAEAMALAVAKAILVHEPGLKSAMRRAGAITRDPRMVERKKPGHVKARKMPTWVKR